MKYYSGMCTDKVTIVAIHHAKTIQSPSKADHNCVMFILTGGAVEWITCTIVEESFDLHH